MRKRCPYCNGILWKDGHNSDGIQRYECSVCCRKSMERTYELEQCPRCGYTNIRKNGFKDGRQKYVCNVCGRNFIERKPRKIKIKEPIIIKENVYEVTCPTCRHTKALKDGTTGGNKQYYKCIKCGTRFLENGKIRLKFKNEMIAFLTKLGNDDKRIANLLNVSLRTIKNYRQQIRKEKYELSEM